MSISDWILEVSMKTPDRITTLIKEARARKAMTQIDVGVACGYSGEVAQVTVAR